MHRVHDRSGLALASLLSPHTLTQAPYTHPGSLSFTHSPPLDPSPRQASEVEKQLEAAEELLIGNQQVRIALEAELR